ncbi:MAG: hypothetical protein CV090_11225, partial [Nitrospira sp. WS238]|nr:hypothetical protein [Nitrospira sp. WS238]
DPDWTPDFGPARLHQSAGAIAIGARPPLIAYNVNLHSTDIAAARSIARSIRHSSGGLPHLKAIGVELPSRGMVQIAMNLTDYQITPIHTALQSIKTEAAKYGIEVAESELIGLVPQAALDQAAATSLELNRFDSGQVLETRIAEALQSRNETEETVSDFLAAVAEATPSRAGGSVTALVGALAASLGVMGARLGRHLDTEQRLLLLSRRLHQLVQEDTAAYEGLMHAYKIPKQHPDSPMAVSTALNKATEVPLEIAELSCEVGKSIHSALPSAKLTVHSDLTVGMTMAIAAAHAALHTVNVNLKLQSNQYLIDALRSRIKQSEQNLEELKRLC